MEIEQSYTKRENKENKTQGQVGQELYALPESSFFGPFISQRRPEVIQLARIIHMRLRRRVEPSGTKAIDLCLGTAYKLSCLSECREHCDRRAKHQVRH